MEPSLAPWQDMLNPLKSDVIAIEPSFDAVSSSGSVISIVMSCSQPFSSVTVKV